MRDPNLKTVATRYPKPLIRAWKQAAKKAKTSESDFARQAIAEKLHRLEEEKKDATA